MKKTLEFSEVVRAPRRVVWDAMLDADTYRDRTSAFCDGSYYEGSWAQGAKIRFPSPDGNGMTAVIAENRPQEFISIRHLGEIVKGAEDFTSERVRAWAPAHENYAFADAEGGTAPCIGVEVTPEFESYLRDTSLKALRRLKAICEGGQAKIATT
jgi:hypothetical protein